MTSNTPYNISEKINNHIIDLKSLEDYSKFL